MMSCATTGSHKASDLADDDEGTVWDGRRGKRCTFRDTLSHSPNVTVYFRCSREFLGKSAVSKDLVGTTTKKKTRMILTTFFSGSSPLFCGMQGNLKALTHGVIALGGWSSQKRRVAVALQTWCVIRYDLKLRIQQQTHIHIIMKTIVANTCAKGAAAAEKRT